MDETPILRDAMLRIAPQDEGREAPANKDLLILGRPGRSARIGPDVSKDLRREESE